MLLNRHLNVPVSLPLAMNDYLAELVSLRKSQNDSLGYDNSVLVC